MTIIPPVSEQRTIPTCTCTKIGGLGRARGGLPWIQRIMLRWVSVKIDFNIRLKIMALWFVLKLKRFCICVALNFSSSITLAMNTTREHQRQFNSLWFSWYLLSPFGTWLGTKVLLLGTTDGQNLYYFNKLNVSFDLSLRGGVLYQLFLMKLTLLLLWRSVAPLAMNLLSSYRCL